MKKNLKLIVELKRPVCRTPIKPVQKHKIDTKFDRKNDKKAILSQIYELGDKNDAKY
jgi:hypothetical protein